MVDIGAGTMDILVYDTQTDLHYKAVVKSPVRYMAEKAAAIPGNLLMVGNEMGGGPITRVLLERTKAAQVVMSRSASATLNHDVEKVKSWGIKVVEDDRADHMRDRHESSRSLKASEYPMRLTRLPFVPRTTGCLTRGFRIWTFATICSRRA
jgi:uncharacterized protein (DUF1786 family)